MTAIIEGFPMGVPLSEEDINVALRRRQLGYGRGDRMTIEKDQAYILSGVYQGKSTGGPITLQVLNKDWENWRQHPHRAVTAPRPGHGDLAGSMKYGIDDARVILERASARETVNRVAIGAVAAKLLAQFNIYCKGFVLQVGDLKLQSPGMLPEKLHHPAETADDLEIEQQRRAFFSLVDKTKSAGDTLGGVVQLVANAVPVGLGSHVHWDRRLDTALTAALISIPSAKAVEIGEVVELVAKPGSAFHDPIQIAPSGRIQRTSNHAGGIEAGISNGEPICIRVYHKPIATLKKGLPSVDMVTKKDTVSAYERSDITVLPAAAVIGEYVMAWVMCRFFMEKFGGDTLTEIKKRYIS